MGFPLSLALRYMGSRKRAMVSVGTLLAVLGVALGTMALVTALGVTSGFRSEFREKVLGVNGHVMVLKYASEFREYRDVITTVERDPDVIAASAFVINPMMVTHAGHTATGISLKGVDPERMVRVLDLPKQMIEGTLDGLRRPNVAAPSGPRALAIDHTGFGSEPVGLDDDAEGAEGSTNPDDSDASPSSEPAGRAIEPSRGFDSQLPDDDVGLETVVSDPCVGGDPLALPGIVLGSTLKEALQVDVGECIQVTSPTIGYAFSGGRILPPIAKQFRVQGVFSAGFDQYDSRFMYSDLHEAQAFHGAGDTVTGVEMRVRDIDDSAAVVERLDVLLNNGIYYALDWEELNRGLFTALRIQQILMSVVLALIILVAAFTVIATLIMIVFDKKREIAALKAMGATDSALLRTFLYQGLIIGCAGTVLGLGWGYVLCRWALHDGIRLDPKVYFVSKLPVVISAENFALTGGFAIFVCLLACVWPALHAARLRPADAFRDL